MAQVTITVCDICQAPDRSTTRYRVARRGASAQTDRCEEHGAELEAIVQSVERKPRHDWTERVTTLEELERRKREQS